MSDHETIRGLLALSASGLLECAEEREVRRHAGECAACAAELQAYAQLTDGIGTLPAPQAPVHLVGQTVVLLALEADRRQGARMASGVAVFGLASAVIVAQALRVLTGDTAAMAWVAWATATSLFGVASAVILKLSRRKYERSAI
ncbi:MAG: hypothetical protein ABI759_07525 [Candidatus Solibacter sp.]